MKKFFGDVSARSGLKKFFGNDSARRERKKFSATFRLGAGEKNFRRDIPFRRKCDIIRAASNNGMIFC
ncbi:MAG: hypothetical protein IJG80_07570 [Selenomonadaceae bacterium]|nr:hypothetical protein [Selenomonadaceae bacterium]MBQ3727393.1 hypothetical protein [Selenomonadaceae bacterium]MBQ9498113.1 hypothetical protein [Selenomonadaceae bacterium]